MTRTASKDQIVARTCACGTCVVEVLSRNSLYAPGHDARHAGLVAREAIHLPMGERRAFINRSLPSAALQLKAVNMVARLTSAKPAKSVKRTSSTVEGTVKVGRWVYPARKLAGGEIVRNTKRDGSGEWIAA